MRRQKMVAAIDGADASQVTNGRKTPPPCGGPTGMPVRMFTADAIRLPPHQAPIRGRAAMRAWLGTFPPIQQFAITADEIVGCDDMAFVRRRYALKAGRVRQREY